MANEDTVQKHSKKNYEAPKIASAHMKEYYKSLVKRVSEDGEPFAIMSANHPHEIFRAMDIPFLVNQWFTGICAAKQLSSNFFDNMEKAGYKRGLCGYCSTSFAFSLGNMENGPYGRLPKPTLILAENFCASSTKIMELFAEQVGAKFYTLENPACLYVPENWWELTRYDWEKLYTGETLNDAVEDFKRLISYLEDTTGRIFDESKLTEVLDLINQQEEYYDKIRNLIAYSVPTPVTVPDVLPAVMQAQWHRGTQWAVNHAKNFYEEIKARADAGYAAVPNERIRLAWIGLGLWQNLAFYQHFEEKYGAAFVWSIYLAVAADNYIRYNIKNKPLRALCSHDITMEDMLNAPPMPTYWYLHELNKSQCDAVILCPDISCAERNIRGYSLLIKVLEDAGFPVLVMDASYLDSTKWDQDKYVSLVEDFLEKRVEPTLKLKKSKIRRV